MTKEDSYLGPILRQNDSGSGNEGGNILDITRKVQVTRHELSQREKTK